MNYGLLVLSFLLCGSGLIFVLFRPFGFMLDGLSFMLFFLGFMLFLDVLHTRKQMEEFNRSMDLHIRRTLELEEDTRRERAYFLDKRKTWICPDCKAINVNEDRVCHHCKRIKPIVRSSKLNR